MICDTRTELKYFSSSYASIWMTTNSFSFLLRFHKTVSRMLNNIIIKKKRLKVRWWTNVLVGLGLFYYSFCCVVRGVSLKRLQAPKSRIPLKNGRKYLLIQHCSPRKLFPIHFFIRKRLFLTNTSTFLGHMPVFDRIILSCT